MHDRLSEQVIPVFMRLADEAARLILEVYRTDFTVTAKEDESPVTDADKRANAHIVKGLSLYFPNIPILAEESEDNLERLNASSVFLVDPLDGTKEFIKRSGEFTVNIALVEHGHPTAGVVQVPVTGVLYMAARDMGAWRVEGGTRHRIHVSDGMGEDLRLIASRSHGRGPLEALIQQNNIQHVIHVGSSLKGCMVAEGLADIHYRFGRTMEWDTAAMQIIVEEAGGTMRNLDGSVMLYNKVLPENRDGFYMVNHPDNRLRLPAL